jgi:acetyl-CoA carboxylase biotin carboxyl carrier protein
VVRFSRRLIAVIRELMGLFGEENVKEIEVERGLFGKGRIRVVKAFEEGPALPGYRVVPERATPPPTEDASGGLHTIHSPMVGMFYRAPGPDASPHVEEGDTVTPGQTLGIIEAMKIMNEIESDIKGKVVRILVENESPVEYNTPLFLLEPL